MHKSLHYLINKVYVNFVGSSVCGGVQFESLNTK